MPYSHLTNAVVSGELTAHEQAMIAAPVSVRDGDDAISFTNPSDSTEVTEETEVVQEGEQVDIKQGEESEEVEIESEETEDESEDEADNEDELEIPEDIDPKTVDEAGEALKQAVEGQNELLAQAIEKGLDKALLPALEAEYQDNGKLSEGSYEALAAIGYSKQFVDSYLKGQQAIADSFVKSVVEYAGGQEVFQKITNLMSTNKALGTAFNEAIDRNDVNTIKALIDSGKTTLRSQFGVKPKRDLTVSAKPAATKPVAPKAEPFESRSDMVKAMSDSRYRTDAKYRASIEARVIASTF